MSPFVHLHLHSEYSLLDGANKVGEIVKQTKKLGMDACAITDHGVMFGCVEFYKKCKALDEKNPEDRPIKPIVGCEVYISPTTRRETGPKAQANHLVLLAQTYQGYLNLCKLTSIGFLEGFYRKPRIDHEVLAKHSEGIVALSACLKGEVAETLVMKGAKLAREKAALYKDIFGPERFFIEIQNHGIPEQLQLLREARALSSDLGLKMVATNDAHYLTGGHAEAHDCLLCIGTGKKKAETNRMKYFSPEFYIKSPDQMAKLFAEFPEAIGITGEIASSIDCTIPFKQRLYPKYRWTEGRTAPEFLRELVAEGLQYRYGNVSEKLRSQADFELAVIDKTGFADYFLVVWDFIKYARDQGIPVGPGRGSGAGSIVAYTLGITDVDPIEHGLLFERFLNPERVSAPDFDIDFCFERRGEVIQYVKQKYGNDNVAQIITFGTLKPKAALRDVGRVLDVPLSRVDQVAKLLPEGPAGPPNLTKALETIPELKKEYDSDPIIRELVETAKLVEGTSRNASVHAAGVVIADQELASLVPIYQPAGTNDRVVQYNMKFVEELGLLKMDFLGLKNLTIINNAIVNVRESEGIEIDWAKISLNEPKTYEFLRRGQTDGIFQLESGGMKDVVKRLGPTCFADVSAILALYRPGPIEAGMIDDYIDRKHKRKAVEYPHPSLEPVLAETYGTIIYQEQVMKITQVMGGFTLGGADLLRRAMGKKDAAAMAKERDKFVQGCVKNGHDAAMAGNLFDTIEKFAGYGFNKSHSVAYAVITFRTAYLMAHHPVAYMAALLTNEISGAKSNEKIPHYISSCRDMGIEVLPPDVNTSLYHFGVLGANEGNRATRFGMGAIKGLGEGVVQGIVAERKKNGPFKSLREFLERIPLKQFNARTAEALVRTGAFDSISPNRAATLHALPAMIEMAGDAQKERDSGQFNLLSMMDEEDHKKGGPAVARSDNLPDIPDWEPMEKLRQEKELLGFYVSGHPLDSWRLDFECFARVSAVQLAAMMPSSSEEVGPDGVALPPRPAQQASGSGDRRGPIISMMGMITQVLNKTTQKGDPMAFATLEDLTGFYEVVIFPRTYEKCAMQLVVGKVVVVEGKVDVGGRSAKLLVDRLTSPEALRKERVKFLDIRLPAGEVSGRSVTQLLQVLGANKGSLPCRFAVQGSSGDTITIHPGATPRVEPSNDALAALEKLPCRPRLSFGLV